MRVTFLALLVISACEPTRPHRLRPESSPEVVGGTTGVGDAQDQARIISLVAERTRDADVGGYRIGPDDLLEVRVPDLLDAPTDALRPPPGYGIVSSVSATPTFAQGLRVSASGDVTLPLLGQVRANGLTPTELEHDIARQLVERGILRVPQVSVTVVEYRSRTVAVVGAVEHPGVFPVTRPGATVGDLIWAAGGPSREAGRLVHLIPVNATSSGGVASASGPIRLDLETLLNPPAGAIGAAIPVRPGDIISLAPAGSVQVEGWVDKPGAYPVTRGLRLSGAVAAAGGPLFAADRGYAEVLRALGSGKSRRFVVDLDAVAQGGASDVTMIDGDVVRVPASTVRLVPWGMWTLVTTMIRMGGDVFF
jgi:polysaccharide export outer membrane protein